jgi:hypothetical protein
MPAKSSALGTSDSGSSSEAPAVGAAPLQMSARAAISSAATAIVAAMNALNGRAPRRHSRSGAVHASRAMARTPSIVARTRDRQRSRVAVSWLGVTSASASIWPSDERIANV